MVDTPKSIIQMFYAYGREDAPLRGLTAGFGIGPAVSPREQLAIGTAQGPDLTTIMLLHFDVITYALA